MVRTYWLVPVFNEASGNLDLQPNRTNDQIESIFGPVLCASILAPLWQLAVTYWGDGARVLPLTGS
jgi:hypothetical protein